MSKKDSIMDYFKFEHLPPNLKETSKTFCLLAEEINSTHVENSEKEVTLRKLLEAKDAAVRSRLFSDKH